MSDINDDDNWFWKDYNIKKKSTAAKIVLALLSDLTDRRGLKHEFNACDNDIQKEIVDTWIKLTEKILKTPQKPHE